MSRIMTSIRRVALKVVAHSWLYPDARRPGLLRWCGIEVGEGATILSGVRFIAPGVSIGRGSWINYGCVIDSLWAPVTIEEHVSIAPQVMIMTATHHVGPSTKRAGDPIRGPVRIGSGSWLGLRCTILPGVTVQPGCIIAAGAVVTTDCAADGLYAGIPARRIRELSTEEPRREPATVAPSALS